MLGGPCSLWRGPQAEGIFSASQVGGVPDGCRGGVPRLKVGLGGGL